MESCDKNKWLNINTLNTTGENGTYHWWHCLFQKRQNPQTIVNLTWWRLVPSICSMFKFPQCLYSANCVASGKSTGILDVAQHSEVSWYCVLARIEQCLHTAGQPTPSHSFTDLHCLCFVGNLFFGVSTIAAIVNAAALATIVWHAAVNLH